ncbi:DUF4625 domain-containing protein [Capnocytophaga felis]|uniref:DUF4625 domain-containing protein n=1 Tax=Capnocytophaga felis TaxID=2267611 RepID=A0A5M4B654_9FLAO|nr:DUF4625 domain-containing protein [Capnocytophaga felis]GET45101.1 hypothetical protein RCZ01_04030 [Capnocytophaga felis]GET47735.1 hypothetical protein RCZ02_05660 [Capnocytophaga felis]
MNINKIKHLFVVLAVVLLQAVVTSCNKDDDNKIEEIIIRKPKVEDLEIGYQNSKKAHPESDLHLEAYITAEETIKSVRVQITPKESGISWFVDITYTKGFAGNKEANLHQHYDIPKKAKEGTYDVLIIVTDAKGNKTIVEDTLTIERDPSLPMATQRSNSYENNMLNVKAKVSALNKLASIHVKVKNIEHTYTDDDLVGQTSYDLDKNIDVSSLANGHYHFFVTITDQKGKKFSYEGHFDKK